jgi:hypothetical protein
MSADPRWTEPRRPWESSNPKVCKNIRVFAALGQAKAKYDHAVNNLERLALVNLLPILTNPKQEYYHGDDRVLAEACALAVIRMVDDITEPLSAVRLPTPIDNGFGEKVVEIREIRNKSAHFVREWSDLQKFFDAATHVLTTEIKSLFDNNYPGIMLIRWLEIGLLPY